MTQDEIIDMADKAEFVSHGKPSDEESELFVCTDKDIVRFAKLVAERALADSMQEVQRLGQEIEQEPVAWMDVDGNVSDNNDHKCFPIPLYTHPPQRTWVGLTDEEFHKACWESYVYPVTGECSTGDREYAVHWTEAKLKEKNT